MNISKQNKTKEQFLVQMPVLIPPPPQKKCFSLRFPPSLPWNPLPAVMRHIQEEKEAGEEKVEKLESLEQAWETGIGLGGLRGRCGKQHNQYAQHGCMRLSG